MKQKSLGILNFPKLEVVGFDGFKGEVTLLVSTREKRISMKANSAWFARQLADCAREIARRHRKHAQWERRTYLELKKYPGYVPEDGEE